MSFWLFIYPVSLLKLSIFPLVARVYTPLTSWSVSVIVAFKFLSNNSRICVMSLAFVDCLFSTPIGIFLILQMLSSFELYPFVCIISWRLLLLFSCSVMSNSLWPHGLQPARLPCLLLSPRACSNSCPLSWWCHPTILSSVVPFSSWVSELCLNSIDNVHISIFVFPGSWAGWVQVSRSSQPFMN